MKKIFCDGCGKEIFDKNGKSNHGGSFSIYNYPIKYRIEHLCNKCVQELKEMIESHYKIKIEKWHGI